jgi:hypothetical protein
MATDRSTKRAIDAGKKNVAAIELVKNWCAHVRIERMGGRGMIEAWTGLPIGHHGLACDHAPAGGMMCWETREAALDFYDRNCASCELRKPVGVPNLSSWVTERDAERQKRQAAEEAAARELASRAAIRQVERDALRSNLSAIAADVVSQIGEIDIQPSTELTKRFVETARLAPEAFPTEVVDYIFRSIEARERWFYDPGLQALAILGSEPTRLARCAMLVLQEGGATRTAAKILATHLPFADRSLVAAVLPRMIDLAAPDHRLFGHDRRPRIAPLVRLAAAFPAEVLAALDALLAREPAAIGLACRGLTILAKRNPAFVVRLSRDIVSKLVRAAWMPEPNDRDHDIVDFAANDVRQAVVEMFICDPEHVDGLLESFRLGASAAGETRIASIYGRILSAGRFRRSRPVSNADRLAFRRLLWMAPKTKNDDILREIQSAIHEDPRELIELARDEVDQLIGAAILLDERLAAFDREPQGEDRTLLEAMERGNRRQTLHSLRDALIGWAAAGVAAAGKPRAYLDILDGLPEDRESFAACLIEHSTALADSADGLNAILPSLYSALVGASVYRRGAAIRALKELPYVQRRNLPDLLFEAFLAALTDPYVYVHRSAVMALSQLHLPKKFEPQVRHGVWAVLLAHHSKSDSDDLVLECIEQCARHLTTSERAGPIGAFLIGLLARMPKWRLGNEIQWIGRELGHGEGAIDLLIALLVDPESHEYTYERVLDALASLPAEIVYANRAKFAAIPIADTWPGRGRIFDLVEILTKCQAWATAEEIAASAIAATPDTVRESSIRLTFELVHAAAAFENSLSQNDTKRASAMAERWRNAIVAKETHDRSVAQRPDPLRNIRRSTAGI